MQNIHDLYTAYKYCQSDIESIGGPVIIKSSFVVINLQERLFLLLVITAHEQSSVAEMCLCVWGGREGAAGRQ